jgi:endonuclease I
VRIYDDVWGALDRTDEDPANPENVILLYTGRSHPKADKDSTARNPGTPTNQSWNREHVWPRSHGLPDEDDLAHNDLHHLKPADRTVNSSRGNKDFDDGGEPHHEAVGSNADGDSFEPRDAVKGDIARMLFYMDVRYEGALDGNDLWLVDRTTNGERTALGRVCTLLRWHHLDPVDAFEQRRHERIVELQGNRNPFIDDPMLAQSLFGMQCPAPPVV